MMKSEYSFIDTPALLVDYDLVMRNLQAMQQKAAACKVKLRPHTKTHKMPELAKLQVSLGAGGITVAKVGEAEVMAENGLDDIFIANEIIGTAKLQRIRNLHQKIKIRLGVDNETQIDQLHEVFKDDEKPIEVLIEVEVGENRSGVVTDDQLIRLTHHIQSKTGVTLKGVFSHDGHSYKAKNADDCRRICRESQTRTLEAANIVSRLGANIDTVSIGSTPSLMHSEIMEGITEIRPGTYIFMDVGQGTALADYSRCAATVLASVISMPTDERIVLDTGAKSLTMQTRSGGICATDGYGLVKNSDNIRLSGLYDEHGLIYDRRLRSRLQVGDKLEVIPNHICPVCNLYEKAYLVAKGAVIKEVPILGRGKTQ